MSESTSFKSYIDRSAIRRLGESIKGARQSFRLDAFVRAAMKDLEPLEFTGRTRHVASALHRYLPEDTAEALGVIRDALPPPLEGDAGMFSERFWLWPLSDFVRDYGASCWREALDTCYDLTQSFTAEFAIRPLLAAQPEASLKLLLAWTDDDSHHVRRLCSEGPRPRLPWASRLAMPRKPVFNILTALKADSSKYVQKSVANHLNDIGKADPEWLIEAMAGWQKRADKHTLWIINHALRTQIKAGDPKALALIGFKNADLTDLELTVNPAKVKIGSKLHATLTLSAPRRGTQALLIDWVMHYARKDRGSSAKVFKGRTIELKAGETFEWQKSFDMTPRRTRSLYPGAHKLEVQINGDVLASVPFTLTR